MYLIFGLSFPGHSLLMHLITGTLVFNIFVKKGVYSLALISSMVLFLGRWSNYIIQVQHIEFLAVASFLVSILIIEKKPLISGLFYAFSISLKHIAIIFLPIFFIKAGILIRNRNIFNFWESQKNIY